MNGTTSQTGRFLSDVVNTVLYDLTRILTDWHNITVEKKLSKAGRREGRNQLKKKSIKKKQ